ncbi:MAG: TetR/AcrR family transcriptional regulator [Gammaproteobacteria bacterium]|nr:TetR/AcrR family transcriptional regulator [Gammaproteobacteria bacterium]
MTEKKERVSKEQWLQKALELFEKQGVNGVKIDQMAKAFGIAKSGFYWHFKNRRDLLEQMLEHWEYEYTLTVKNLLESKKELPPEQLLLTIMQIVRKNKLGRYDLAVKSWAETDKLACEYIQRTYQLRHDIVKGIFKSLGYKGNELEARTRLFVVYEAWSHCVFSEDSDKKLAALEKERLKIYTT